MVQTVQGFGSVLSVQSVVERKKLSVVKEEKLSVAEKGNTLVMEIFFVRLSQCAE